MRWPGFRANTTYSVLKNWSVFSRSSVLLHPPSAVFSLSSRTTRRSHKPLRFLREVVLPTLMPLQNHLTAYFFSSMLFLQLQKNKITG